MEESILNDLGFDPVYLLIASAILTLILMVVTILCLINMRKLYRRYDIFMRGKDAESMENMIVDQMNAIIELQSQDRYNKDSIRTANKNSRAAFQKIGIVKYNAFKGMGGNLSFALAMLDYTNTGFVLNSVHSREGCYLYLKDVERGETEVLLGGKNTLNNPDLKAVIIELNGSGARYGYKDADIHAMFITAGFRPYAYEPFTRQLTELNAYSDESNTIYIRDVDFVKNRIRVSDAFKVLGLEI